MRILVVAFLAINVLSCSFISSSTIVGDWRAVQDNGSWVSYSFKKDGTGEKESWNAENRCKSESAISWRKQGSEFVIDEAPMAMEAVQLRYGAVFEHDSSGREVLNVQIYDFALARPDEKHNNLFQCIPAPTVPPSDSLDAASPQAAAEQGR